MEGKILTVIKIIARVMEVIVDEIRDWKMMEK